MKPKRFEFYNDKIGLWFSENTLRYQKLLRQYFFYEELAGARTGETQDVPDVHARPEHIACSSSTNSEVVVPVKNSQGEVVAVLDLDSDEHAAFSKDDIVLAERVCLWLGQTYH